MAHDHHSHSHQSCDNTNGDSHCCCHHHHHHHDHDSGAHAESGLIAKLHSFCREITSAVLLIAGAVASHFGLFSAISGEGNFDWAALLWYIAAVMPVAVVVVADAWKDWKRGDFMNEFTLMLLAAAGAFVIGEYPEAVAVLLFYSFGEKLEDHASADVRSRIRNLIGRLPEKATVVENGVSRECSPKDVAPGSVILVKPGERVPIDGKLSGDTELAFDTSAITGEAVPRNYAPGTEVPSGVIPVDRQAEIVTSRPFADSSMSRMLRLIEEAAAKKSPAESMLRRITRWYTPVVLVLAVLLFAVPWIVALAGSADFEWMMWMKRSLVFLVCCCPCALVVSVPLSYFASMGRASRLGLLFKDSAHIDAVRKADTIFFDKTGTLTTGSFHVVKTVPAGDASSANVMGVAGSLDAGSAHPLAKAVEEWCMLNSIKTDSESRPVTVAHGIKGTYFGKAALAGSRKLLEAEHIDVPEATEPFTEICVALDGRYIGSVYLEDTLKPEAKQALAELHSLGVKRIIILSGDRDQAVARVASEAGADSYQASLLPEDKQKIVDKARSESHHVVFVGDGINDAPALTSADTGVAMGTHGTDMAMESADVVVAGDNLLTIPDAIRLSRKVRHVVVENVSFAIGVKILVMALGAFGIATLWAAVFADTGVTLITILWTILNLSLFIKKR